jgi:hypothetical protein
MIPEVGECNYWHCFAVVTTVAKVGIYRESREYKEMKKNKKDEENKEKDSQISNVNQFYRCKEAIEILKISCHTLNNRAHLGFIKPSQIFLVKSMQNPSQNTLSSSKVGQKVIFETS